MLANNRILLIVAGGIAAYKCLDLVRQFRRAGASVRCVLTRAGAEFVTPLSLQALSEDKVYSELFSLTDESEMGHIQLSRAADLLVLAPATADMIAKFAHGHASDLASTVLLATDKPVLIAPAMNVRMWEHPAVQANMALLRERQVRVVGPNVGDMACGEHGPGRMAEPQEILDAVVGLLGGAKPLAGRRAIVTSGPTWEAIDPVRYIANRSSGKQGHAIAAALARAGATTTLVSGPTNLPAPPGVALIGVESAREMLAACEQALPADVAVCAAAVSDWRVSQSANQKLKKDGGAAPQLALTENPDILATISRAGAGRPSLVVGFAAETENVVAHAQAKRARKGCDWILANDVGLGTNTFGGEDNTIHCVTEAETVTWPTMTKLAVAERLADQIAAHFAAAE